MSRRKTFVKNRRPTVPYSARGQAAPDELAACDMWGRPLAHDETADEEAARLLMSLNWLCDLLEHMQRTPADADRIRADCSELIGRLSASCRSPALRKGLADAGAHIGARRYRDALTILRSLAV